MNKQQLLDIDNPTPQEWAAQQLLVRMSPTRLKEVDRVIREVYKTLYKTFAREMSVDDLSLVIQAALNLSQDKPVQDDLTIQ